MSIERLADALIALCCGTHSLGLVYEFLLRPAIGANQANGSGRLHWALKSASVQYRAAHWQRLPISLFQFTNLVLETRKFFFPRLHKGLVLAVKAIQLFR
jgi:hypothetical protein